MKAHQPPKLARRIFEWYCANAHVEDLLGDMDEWFYVNLEKHSPAKAKIKYWKQILSLIFSYAIRKRKKNSRYSPFASTSHSMGIIRNYFIIAARNLSKHKYFTSINAIGLAIGMSLSLLLITMYAFVNTYDDFHDNKSNIYRIISSYHKDSYEVNMASAPLLLAEKFQSGFSGIRSAVRIRSDFYGDVSLSNMNIPLQGYYTDREFLSTFSFELLEGNINEALKKPNSIILTQTAARKLFGDKSGFGSSIEVLKQGNFQVTGILKDPPVNTHMVFECLVSYATVSTQEQGSVINFENPFTYGREFVYLLVNGDKPLKHIEDYLAKLSKEDSKNSDATIQYELQALTDINPGRSLAMMTGGLGPSWDLEGFYIFGSLCLLILIPACFNYANISIARAMKRAKEIGLRKTMGGQRGQIFLQFITETVVITFISLLGSLLLFLIVRNEFQSMMSMASSLDLSLTWTNVLLFALFAVFTGLMAGLAPAIYFAKLNPIQALKNQSSTKVFSGIWLRKGLTVFQFMLSFGFIVALIVFARQYKHTMNYDFGFQQENILDVELQNADPNLFVSEFSKLSPVKSISFSSDVLGLHSSGGDSWMQYESKTDSLPVNEIFVSRPYIENLELKFIAGSNFPDEVWSHERHIIVNEQFLKEFNIPDAADAVGKVVTVGHKELEVIGVLKDFHFSTLRQPIESFAFRMDPSRYQIANLKVSFTDAYGGISEMEKVWKSIGNQTTFKASFFHDEINRAYEFYRTLMKIIGYLGLLAISISLLGMLGMVIYSTETRTKEVGVRKVLGASVSGILYMLSKEYLKLLAWAFLFGIPLAVFIIGWLLGAMQHYSVQLNVWDILGGAAILIILALFTMSSQTFKVANTNPAETLKNE